MKSRTSSWLKRWAILVAAFVGSSACIQREVTIECVPVAGEAETSTPARAPRKATGNWGKVEGESVLPAEGIRAFTLNGKTDLAEISFYPVEGQPFEEALRADVKGGAKNNWDAQVQAPIAKPVERGDVLLATFYFRTEWAPQESGEGQSEFVFELAKDPWTKSATFKLLASREWKKFHVGFVAEESYAPGDAQMIFRLGYSPEKIDFAGISVENFGKKLALADLPTTEVTYAGREADAPWRKAAAERIEQYRKAELSVLVQDAAGKPLPNADVHVELAEHSFQFGTAVVAKRVAGDGEQTYKQKIIDHFNLATLENNLKWVALDGDWGDGYTMEQAKAAIAWLDQKGIPTRAHVLIWPGWRNLPKFLRAYESKPEEMRKIVRDHIAEVATATKGLVPEWDVMNEPFDNHDLIDILGKEEMIEWFNIAKRSDPGAQLFINDYAILSGGGGTTPHRDHYEATIKYLLDNGAPVEGIGMQGHFGTSLTSPDDLKALLDRYAKFEKPITITEFDVVVDDDQLAADYTRDFYTMLFSHPITQGIVMWGFWDRTHWKKNAVMYDKNWKLKPAGQAYLDLIDKEWHTDARGKTDSSGRYATRGFHGKYVVEVNVGGKQKRVGTSLDRQGKRIVVTID